MTGIAALLLAVALAHALARLLRLPPLPLQLLAGLAFSTLHAVPSQLLQDALVLGFTFVAFATGLELSPRHVRAHRRTVARVGVVQFTAVGAIGYLASLLLGLGALQSAYLGFALTASSTLIVVRLLRSRRQLFEPLGRLVLGVLLLQDLLLVALIPLAAFAPGGGLGSARVLGLGVLAVLLTLATRHWVAPLFRRLDQDDEALLLTALGVMFAFIGLAYVLRLPLVVGAFLAGVGLSSFPTSGLLRPHVTSVGELFSSIFFVTLGALVGIPTLDELRLAAVLALVVIVATPPIVAALAERAGFSPRPALEAGLLLAQTSELSLVVGLFGLMSGHVSQPVFTAIALVTIITMLLTPLLTHERVVNLLLHFYPIREPGIAPPAGGHVVIVGAGSTGMPLVETVLASGLDVVVIDDDPDVVRRLRQADIPVIRGDAARPHVLAGAAVATARAVSSTMRRPRDNRLLLELARDVPVIVRVFEHSDAEWVRSLGGIPVLYSEAAAANLLRWFYHESPPADRRAEPRG